MKMPRYLIYKWQQSLVKDFNECVEMEKNCHRYPNQYER